MNEIYSVRRLNEYVNELIASDPITKLVQVRGEISGYKKYPSGHAYFQIKDEDASVRCVLFRGHFSKISIQPEEGMQVIISARAGIYVQDGRFQLIVYDMQNDGIGTLYRQFEILKRELKDKGWFDNSIKQQIPMIPQRIGVITSPKGAVISDIIQVLSRRYSGFDALIYPVSVQGATSSEEMVRAIQWFNKTRSVDVIILARGGGSIEDLWSFNDRRLAYAIFDSKIPIVSAVGHETDYTIADFVSDLRAPTPSAAAELVLPEKRVLLEQVRHIDMNLKNAIHSYLNSIRNRLEMTKNHKAMTRPQTYIDAQSQRLDHLNQRLKSSMSSDIDKRFSSYSLLKSKLNALSPFSVLERGYAWVSSVDDRMIQSVSEVKEKDALKIYMIDGRINTLVVNTEIEVCDE